MMTRDEGRGVAGTRMLAGCRECRPKRAARLTPPYTLTVDKVSKSAAAQGEISCEWFPVYSLYVMWTVLLKARKFPVCSLHCVSICYSQAGSKASAGPASLSVHAAPSPSLGASLALLQQPLWQMKLSYCRSLDKARERNNVEYCAPLRPRKC